MKNTLIRLNSPEAVQEFVNAAGKCSFDVDAKVNSLLIELGKIKEIKDRVTQKGDTLNFNYTGLIDSDYEEDDEAYALWRDKIGVPEEHIVRLGKADNFWEHGTGPCGPCSEIYFDRGEKYGCGAPDCKPGCECDRYMEIWNNVFTQFNNMGDGTYTELEHKNIDTGMGLERLACVMQGVDNMFEVDSVRRILDTVCDIAGKEYGKDKNNDVSIRAITDHSRSATFMICDGVVPSNEGRGYVLRRLIRRAARHGRLLGITRAFLTETATVAIEESKNAYPDLESRKEFILKVIANEEKAFAKTIDLGLSMLEDLTAKGGTLSAEDAFKLYDTYGFPFDLTKDILQEKNMTVDEDGFKALMDEQRRRAREGRKASDSESWKSDGISFDGVEDTVFLGYTDTTVEATVKAIVVGGELTDTVGEGEKALIVLDKTVFYGEGGGQVGDTGVISNANCNIMVSNTTKAGGIFTHMVEVEAGSVSVGDKVTAIIDADRRAAIRRNHTAAHLLQAALRTVLGNHVEQAGQLVNDAVVRFDFTHFSALTAEEINAVESLINTKILQGINVDNREMPIDEAKKLGAMALFGEKYGDVVRVVNAEGFSIELCGGTHVDNTAKIGLIKIVSETSVAAGVRRIEAVTGANVLDLLNKYKGIIDDAADAIKSANPMEIAAKARAVAAELKESEKKVEALNAKLAGSKISDLMAGANEVNGVKIITARLDGTQPNDLRTMCDKVKGDNDCAVCLFAAVNGDKLTFCAAAGKDAITKGANAGNIVREVAKIAGGNGGGKPDSAMAGGKDISKADEAVAAAKDIIANMIK